MKTIAKKIGLLLVVMSLCATLFMGCSNGNTDAPSDDGQTSVADVDPGTDDGAVDPVQ